MNPENLTDILTRVKLLLGLEWDIEEEDILNEFINNFATMVMLYIQADVLPVELNWVVVEATVSRYNRRQSEGYESENFGEIGINYLEDILTPYYPFLDSFRTNNRKVKFL